MPPTLAPSLLDRVEQKLARPAPAAARAVCDALRPRLGESVVAVLFYGSCLRRESSEGVLDFYVLVDSYRSAYRSRWLALANAILPPNVFYLELDTEGQTLRAKYAVISCRDFARAVAPECSTPYVWARFAQPALRVYARDEWAKDFTRETLSRAVVTLVQRLGVFLPATGRLQRFSPAALWREAFGLTYGAEIRPETHDAAQKLYDDSRAHFDAVALAALTQLESEGWLVRVSQRGNSVEVEMDPSRRARARLRWWLARPLAKGLAFLRLLKTATTFGDWLPYALWKLERHSGVRIVPSDRLRKHPLIFGWPVILKLLMRRELR